MTRKCVTKAACAGTSEAQRYTMWLSAEPRPATKIRGSYAPRRAPSHHSHCHRLQDSTVHPLVWIKDHICLLGPGLLFVVYCPQKSRSTNSFETVQKYKLIYLLVISGTVVRDPTMRQHCILLFQIATI